MGIERTEKEIYDQIDLANAALDEGGKFPGMSYEDGVKIALEWATGNSDDKPMED